MAGKTGNDKAKATSQTKKPATKTKDVAGLAAAKKATKMTKEQWARHQIGMAEKWPAPDYMKLPHPESKGGTSYRDETFEKTTRFMEHTVIEYRPHAKAPGSKSHVRYESYSKARTVGEALKLKSWPGDWCWDIERGYLRIIGPLRDEPIDISEVKDESTLTPVDTAVHQWYRRELAKKLGLNYKDLFVDKGSQESTLLRAHRLVAQREAKRILEEAAKTKRSVTDEDVTTVLKAWGFRRNVTRQNVMRPGESWVWSDTLGLLRDRTGDIHLTQPTHKYPEVVQVLSKWLTDRLGATSASQFSWTSFNLNKDYAGAIHRDGNNFGPSMISAFGEFSGGQLRYFPEDDGKQDLPELERSGSPEQFNLKDGLALFNGNSAHCVSDFTGNRFTVVYFTGSYHDKMKPADRDALQACGVVVPKVDTSPYELLRPPLGYKGKRAVATPQAQSSTLPAFSYWKKSTLTASKSKKVVKR